MNNERKKNKQNKQGLTIVNPFTLSVTAGDCQTTVRRGLTIVKSRACNGLTVASN